MRDLLYLPTFLIIFWSIVAEVHAQPTGIPEWSETQFSETSELITSPNFSLPLLLPQEALVYGSLATEATSALLRNIYTRLYVVQEGSRCIDRYNLDRPLNNHIRHYPFFTPDKLCPGKVKVEELNRFGFFVNSHFSDGHKATSQDVPDFDFGSYGLTAGIDYRVTDRFVVGGALGHSEVAADLTNETSEIDADSYNLALYSVLYEVDKFYFDVIYNYTTHHYDTARMIPVMRDHEVLEQFFSDYGTEDAQHVLSLGLGYHLHYKRFTFTPSIRLEYFHLFIDSFEEDFADSNILKESSLNVAQQDLDKVAMRLSTEISYTQLLQWGLLIPQLRLQAIFEPHNEIRSIKGQFQYQDQQIPFNLYAEPPDDTYFTVGLGILAQFARDKMIYLDYETVLDLNKVKRHTLTAGVRLAF